MSRPAEKGDPHTLAGDVPVVATAGRARETERGVRASARMARSPRASAAVAQDPATPRPPAAPKAKSTTTSSARKRRGLRRREPRPDPAHPPNFPNPRSVSRPLRLALPARRRRWRRRQHLPARPRARSGTEAGACGRRAEFLGGSGALGGARLSTRRRRRRWRRRGLPPVSLRARGPARLSPRSPRGGSPCARRLRSAPPRAWAREDHGTRSLLTSRGT